MYATCFGQECDSSLKETSIPLNAKINTTLILKQELLFFFTGCHVPGISILIWNKL